MPPNNKQSVLQPDGPEENDLLIFGSLLPSQSTLRMTVARVTLPRPAAPRIRPPRPDDPTPRRPPTFDLGNASKKRRHLSHDDSTQGDDRPTKRGKADQFIDLKTLMAKDAMFRPPDADVAGKGRGKARASGHAAEFKVPGPVVGPREDEDVFGGSAVPTASKAAAAGDLEISNKTVSPIAICCSRSLTGIPQMVKKVAVKALAARGMPKEHPGFKELFGWITRGVGFALVCRFV